MSWRGLRLRRGSSELMSPPPDLGNTQPRGRGAEAAGTLGRPGPWCRADAGPWPHIRTRTWPAGHRRRSIASLRPGDGISYPQLPGSLAPTQVDETLAGPPGRCEEDGSNNGEGLTHCEPLEIDHLRGYRSAQGPQRGSVHLHAWINQQVEPAQQRTRARALSMRARFPTGSAVWTRGAGWQGKRA